MFFGDIFLLFMAEKNKFKSESSLFNPQVYNISTLINTLNNFSTYPQSIKSLSTFLIYT